MKKLVLIIIGVALLGGNAKVHSQGISLNGFQYAEAYKMIKFYQENRKQDKNPTKQSMWFSAQNFKLIVDLLQKEHDHPKEPQHPTDGMRVYFATYPGVGAGSLRNTIILVPTREYGDDLSAPSKKLHHDYYDHDPADLAILAQIQIKLYKKHIIHPGAKLYSYSQNSDQPCPDPGPHYIDRKMAEQMVDNFGFDTIQTKSEWFDLKFLKSFVDDTHPHDGVRLYFAKHSSNDPEIRGQKVASMEAFIWVPTEKRGWPFVTHRDYFDCSTTHDFYKSLAFGPGGGPGGQDNGELCPSNCDPIPPTPPAGG